MHYFNKVLAHMAKLFRGINRLLTEALFCQPQDDRLAAECFLLLTGEEIHCSKSEFFSYIWLSTPEIGTVLKNWLVYCTRL